MMEWCGNERFLNKSQSNSNTNKEQMQKKKKLMVDLERGKYDNLLLSYLYFLLKNPQTQQIKRNKTTNVIKIW